MFATSNTITTNVTTTAGYNYMSPGPITVNPGFTVTIVSGTRWIVF